MSFDDLGDTFFAKVVSTAENPGKPTERIVMFETDVATEMIFKTKRLFVHLANWFTILIIWADDMLDKR